jgi:hypothetical protein
VRRPITTTPRGLCAMTRKCAEPAKWWVLTRDPESHLDADTASCEGHAEKHAPPWRVET